MPLINEESEEKIKSSVRQYVDAEDEEYEEDFCEPREEDPTPVTQMEEDSYNFQV